MNCYTSKIKVLKTFEIVVSFVISLAYFFSNFFYCFYVQICSKITKMYYGAVQCNFLINMPVISKVAYLKI